MSLDPEWSGLLVCPEDRGRLEIEAGATALAGLRCRRCRREFPVEDGIPRLLPLALARALEADPGAAGGTRDVGLRASEARLRDEESAIYDDIFPDAEFRHELDAYVRLLDPGPEDVVLDVGAGTGRVVKEYAGRCRAVACADFSLESLRRCATREELRGRRLLAVQADATALPFRDASFDRVAALGLLCLLPTDALRERFVDELRRVVRPRGVVVVSTYHYALVKRLWAAAGRPEGALREGFQSAGRVYYRNETRGEFVAALSRRFRVHEVRGVCHRVPILSNLSRGLSRRLDGLLGATRLGFRPFATEMVARCTPLAGGDADSPRS